MIETMPTALWCFFSTGRSDGHGEEDGSSEVLVAIAEFTTLTVNLSPGLLVNLERRRETDVDVRRNVEHCLSLDVGRTCEGYGYVADDG